jgi:hypothetical protein
MGLFSARGLQRPAAFRFPIRLHSEHSLAGAGRRLRGLPGRVPPLAVSAINDIRVVTALLVLAAAALAVEMAFSLGVL